MVELLPYYDDFLRPIKILLHDLNEKKKLLYTYMMTLENFTQKG